MAIKKSQDFVIKIKVQGDADDKFHDASIESKRLMESVAELQQVIAENRELFRSQARAIKISDDASMAFRQNLDGLTVAVNENRAVLVDNELALATYANTAISAGKGLVSFTEQVVSLAHSLVSLGSQENLRSLSNILLVASLFARMKGFGELGKELKFASDKILEFSDKAEQLKQNATTRLQETAEVYRKVTGVLGTALKFVAGSIASVVAIKFAPYLLEAASKISFLNPLATRLSNTFSVLGGIMQATITNVKNFKLGWLGVGEALDGLKLVLAIITPLLWNAGGATNGFAAGLTAMGAAAGFVSGLIINKIIGGLGELSIALGGHLLTAMDTFEEKFIKAESVVSQFTFTIGGLIRTLGTNAVGSLDHWNKTLDELRENTTFATNDITSAMKALISEGARFGLNSDQIAAVIQRTADIASGFKENITDTASKINAAFAGSTQSLQNMGFAVSDAMLVHDDYFLSLGKTADQLTKTEMAQVRFNVIMHETEALAGAAANEFTTLEGAAKAYEKVVTDVQVALGETSVVTKLILEAQTNFLRVVLKLPKAIFNVIGGLQEYTGVLAIVIGTLLKYLATISLVALSFKILNTLLATNAVVQSKLTVAAEFAAKAMGTQAVAVTSLNTALANLLIIGRATIANIFASMGHALRGLIPMILAATKAMWAFTVSLLSNPLVIMGTAIVATVLGFGNAIHSLFTEVKFLNQMMVAIVKPVTDFFGKMGEGESIFVRLGNIISSVFKAVVNVFKVLVGGVATFVTSLAVGIVYMKRFSRFISSGFKESEEDTAAFNLQLKEAVERLKQSADFTIASEKAILGNGAALAAAGEQYDSYGNKIDHAKEKLDKLVAAQLKGFDEATERVKAYGNEFEKALTIRSTAQTSLNTAMEANLDLDDKAKAIAEAKKELILSEIQIEKLKLDTLKSIGDEDRKLQIENLRRAGANIAALKLERKDRIAAFDTQVKQLESLGALTDEQSAKIIEARAKLQQAFKLDIAKEAADQTKKTQQTAVSAFEKLAGTIKSLGNEIIKSGQTEAQVIRATAAARIYDATAVEGQLLAVKALTAERKAQIDALIALVKESEALQISALRQKGVADANKENLSLMEKISEIGKDQVQIANLKLERELALVDAKIAQATADGLITQENRALLEVLEKQKALMEKAAVPDIMDAKQKVLEKDAHDFGGEQTVALLKGAQSFMGVVSKGFAALRVPFISKDMQDSISLGFAKGATVFANVVKQGAAFVANALNGTYVNRLADFIESLAQAPEEFIKAFERLDKIIVNFFNKLPAILEKLMKKLPEIIQNIIKKLPEFAKVLGDVFKQMAKIMAETGAAMMESLMDAFGNLLDALPEIFDRLIQSIPDVVESFMQKLPMIFEKLLGDVIPELFRSIFKMIPTLFEKFADNIGPVVESFVSEFIGMIGEIVAAFIDEFFMKGGLERMVGSILRMIPRIVVAFVKGVIKGLIKFFEAIGDVFKGRTRAPKWIENLPDQIENASNKLGKQLAKDAANIFSVKNFDEAAKAMSGNEVSTAISTEIANAFKKGTNMLNHWLEVLQNVWRSIWNTVFQPVVDFFGTLFEQFREEILEPIGRVLSTIGRKIVDGFMQGVGLVRTGMEWINTKIFQPFANLVSNVFNSFTEKVLNPLIGALTTFGEKAKTAFGDLGTQLKALGTNFSDAGKSIGQGAIDKLFEARDTIKGYGTAIATAVTDKLNTMGDTLKGYGGKISDGLKDAFNGLSQFFKDIGTKMANAFKDAIGSISIGGGGSGGSNKGSITGISGSPIAIGGTVKQAWQYARTQYAAQGTTMLFQPRNGDTVPAMLTPGEEVIRRESAAPNRALLKSINAAGGKVSIGGGGGGTVVTIQSVNIHAKTMLDAKTIKSEIVPVFFEELKRKTRDGVGVVYQSGVRNT